MPPLPVQLSRRLHQSVPSTDDGRGGKAEAIAPTVADQPHCPPAPALDVVYALEVATSEAAVLPPGAGRRLPCMTLQKNRCAANGASDPMC